MSTNWTASGYDDAIYQLSTYVERPAAYGANYSVPLACFNNNIQFRTDSEITAGSQYSTASYCWNYLTTSWYPVRSPSAPSSNGLARYIYENGLYLIDYQNTTISPGDNSQHITLYFQQDDGSWNSSTVYFTVEPRISVFAHSEGGSGNLTFNITFSNGTTTAEYTNQTNLIETWDNLPYGLNTITIVDYAGTYQARTYYLTILQDYAYTLDAYLLPVADTTLINFVIIDAQSSGVSNALLRVYEPDTVLVEEDYSDSSGTATAHLDMTTEYKIMVSKTGYDTETAYITPTNPPYIITLTQSPVGTYTTAFNWITYKILPWRALTTTTENITFILTSENSDIEYYGLNITYGGSLVNYTYSDSEPYGGSLTGSVDLSGVTSSAMVYVTAYFKKTDYNQIPITKNYIVYYVSPGNYSLINTVSVAEADLNSFEKYMITILATMFITIALGASFSSLRGFGLGFVAVGCLAFFANIGWFDWTYVIVLGVLQGGLWFVWRD